MTSGAPWWAFIVTAAVSLGSAFFSWYMTHRSASKRDIQNWRRGELLKHTSKLIELSTKRNEMLRSRLYELTEPVFWTTKDWDLHSDLVVEMRSLIDQLKLLQAKKLIARFEGLIQLHQDSEYHIRDDEYDETALFLATIDPNEQEIEHQKVIDEFQRTIEQRRFPGIAKSDII